MVGANPAAFGGEGVVGQERGSNPDRKSEAGIPLQLLPAQKTPASRQAGRQAGSSLQLDSCEYPGKYPPPLPRSKHRQHMTVSNYSHFTLMSPENKSHSIQLLVQLVLESEKGPLTVKV